MTFKTHHSITRDQWCKWYSDWRKYHHKGREQAPSTYAHILLRRVWEASDPLEARVRWWAKVYKRTLIPRVTHYKMMRIRHPLTKR